jgi:hypothetical protein
VIAGCEAPRRAAEVLLTGVAHRVE